jgi:Schlafen, AlbA_2
VSLSRLNFDDVSEADLAALVGAGIPEGLLIEYKSAAYGRADADVREFLKDVSAFANASGGHLVIGMTENAGVAAALSPLAGLDPDQEVLRLENIMRDGIDPRIAGIRIKQIPIAAGGFVIIIRIPKSWNPPHRVSARNSNRFYVRNSAGAHEASVEELRVLFNLAATAQDRIRAFRQERLARVTSGDTPCEMAREPGTLLLHIVPLAAFSRGNQIDLGRAQQLQDSLRPMGAMGYTQRFNFDGMIVATGAPTHAYTQLFRNGVIESVRVKAIAQYQGHPIIPSVDFDQKILEVLPLYFNALQALDVPPPLVAMLTLDGVRGAILGINANQLAIEVPAPITHSVLELPEVVVESYGTEHDYQRAIRPAFDALWNAGGFQASRYFGADGRWTGPAQR